MALQQLSEPFPFPFLQLPKDIRLMVYECIPIKVKLHELRGYSTSKNYPSPCGVIDRTVPVAILATCRQISEEAKSIMRAKMRDIIALPPRMIAREWGAIQHMSRFLLAASWLQRNSSSTLDSSICPEKFKELLDDSDYRLLLAIALRWIRCGNGKQGDTLDKHPPTIEVGICNSEAAFKDVFYLMGACRRPDTFDIDGAQRNLRMILVKFATYQVNAPVPDPVKYIVTQLLPASRAQRVELGEDVEDDEYKDS